MRQLAIVQFFTWFALFCMWIHGRRCMLSNAIPAQKMGFYMGVFNFFIVIPQILASLGPGKLMKSVLGNDPMNAVLLGGGSMLVAAVCVGFVSKDVDNFTEAESAPAEASLTAVQTV